jgi:hypothetical protein
MQPNKKAKQSTENNLKSSKPTCTQREIQFKPSWALFKLHLQLKLKPKPNPEARAKAEAKTTAVSKQHTASVLAAPSSARAYFLLNEA